MSSHSNANCRISYFVVTLSVPDVEYTQHENTFLHSESRTTSGWNWNSWHSKG